MMVEPPAVDVTISPAPGFFATGALAARAEQFARKAIESWQIRTLPMCEVDVRSPPDHVGFGAGTQLGLAVAAGLRRFLALPDLPVEELAASIGRGQRSSVGTYGFQHGGLIVDAGKESGQRLGRLAHRIAVPEAWRIVLARSDGVQGLAGDHEADVFRRLPPVPDAVTRELWRIVETQMLPAIGRSDCAAFGEAVYHFGRLAGECFAAVQGGPFASPAVAGLVNAIRNYGVAGVGQSSWGPTVFALLPSDREANALCDWLKRSLGIWACNLAIARPNNVGAQVSTL
jgi:beta-RFAP synthase